MRRHAASRLPGAELVTSITIRHEIASALGVSYQAADAGATSYNIAAA